LKAAYVLNVWRLHPIGIRVVSAEPTLRGSANKDAVRFCQPYASANALGWWVFSGIDLDIRWNADGTFDHRLLEPYTDADRRLVEALCAESDIAGLDVFCPVISGRTKLSFGAVETNIVQLWTGCILQTQPGICLQVRDPVNFGTERGIRVMEGVLETDWMNYDIWLNLVVTERGRWVSIRRDDATPLAQLIPLSREAIESSARIGRDELISRSDEAAGSVFDFWLNYNRQKFCGDGRDPLSPTDPTVRKDSRTYHRQRSDSLLRRRR
jgi:hypothetical protein